MVHFLPPIQKIPWKAVIVLEDTKAAPVKLNTVQGVLNDFQEQSKQEVSQNHVFPMCVLPKVYSKVENTKAQLGIYLPLNQREFSDLITKTIWE